MISKVKKIRLSEHDLASLKATFLENFLPGDRLWIFGSRVDLTKKGGDIDLYIETYATNVKDALKMRKNFISMLEEKIGEQKIDVVLNFINYPYPLFIHKVALNEGIRII
jgi:hypothetical protein